MKTCDIPIAISVLALASSLPATYMNRYDIATYEILLSINLLLLTAVGIMISRGDQKV